MGVSDYSKHDEERTPEEEAMLARILARGEKWTREVEKILGPKLATLITRPHYQVNGGLYFYGGDKAYDKYVNEMLETARRIAKIDPSGMSEEEIFEKLAWPLACIEDKYPFAVP